MRLLFVTQAVDREDAALGFVHGWLAEFAKHFESITVICLREGAHALPANVRVYSLGKEKGTTRLTQALRVLLYTVRLRHSYSSVFVHMNHEYLLLAGPLWKLLGKRAYLWRNHYAGNILTDIAAIFCTRVFCTSRSSYTAKYKKTVLMPVGVDTSVFTPQQGVRAADSILFLGRIVPSKRPELLLEALRALQGLNTTFEATVCGPGDAPYIEGLKRRAQELGIAQKVQFLPALPNVKTPHLFSRHEVFVNLSPSGMYDKTIFEAAACGCLVLVASKDAASLLDARSIVKSDSPDRVALDIKTLLGLSGEEKESVVSKQHNLVVNNTLEVLSKRIVAELRV